MVPVNAVPVNAVPVNAATTAPLALAALRAILVRGTRVHSCPGPTPRADRDLRASRLGNSNYTSDLPRGKILLAGMLPACVDFSVKIGTGYIDCTGRRSSDCLAVPILCWQFARFVVASIRRGRYTKLSRNRYRSGGSSFGSSSFAEKQVIEVTGLAYFSFRVRAL